jgi:hypothetical protein
MNKLLNTPIIGPSAFLRFHYHDRDVLSRRPDLEAHFEPSQDRAVSGRQMTLHYHRYVGEQALKKAGTFGDGNEALSFWTDYPDIRFALEDLGFTHITDASDNLDNPNGPARYLLAVRAEHRPS